MTRNLPTQLPLAAHKAVQSVIEEGARIEGNRSVAEGAYREHLRAAWLSWSMEPEGHELLAMACAIVDWGAALRDSPLLWDLFNRFREPDDESLSLSLVCHQIDVPARDTAPGGTLKIDLVLELNPHDAAPFRHHAWFDGYRVTGGGLIDTGLALRDALLPPMLRAIHELIAEGQHWDRFIYALEAFPERLRDR